jgi:outer membrane protein TolC
VREKYYYIKLLINNILIRMKSYSIHIFFAIILYFISIQTSLSQDSTYLKVINDTIIVDGRIPALKVFIESALNNSPLLKVSDSQINMIFEQIKKQKKSWTDFVYFDANARYGLFNQLTISDLSTSDLGSVTTNNSKEMFNYYAGITFKVPLSTLLTRKNDLKILNENLQENKLKKEDQKNILTRMVIDEYYNLQFLFQNLQAQQHVLESLNISYMRAKKDFENGISEISDFTTIVAAKGKEEESYYKTLNDYLAQFNKLIVLTGITITTKK